MASRFAESLVQGLVFTLVLSLIAFLTMAVAPGDPAEMLLGQDATPEGVRAMRAELGLDLPLWKQYAAFLLRLAQGDLGRSYENRRPVTNILIEGLVSSSQLAGGALLVAVVVGVSIGLVSAYFRNSWFDLTLRIVVLMAISVPVFWLGLMAIYLFAVQLRWLPSFGRGGAEHLILPVLCLSSAALGIVIRITRSEALEVMKREFITAARAKGLSEIVVVCKHVLKNALVGLITVVGLQFGLFMSYAVVVETIFAWPGLGTTLIKAVFSRDFPVIRGGIILTGAAFVIISVATDRLCAVLDPRTRTA